MSATAAACNLGLATPDQVLEDILVDHEDYLQNFVNMHHTVMELEPQLSPEERSYISIMAACRHKSSVLLVETRCRFKDSGGPEEWLESLEHAPKRLQCLHKTNMLLAHRPWMFNRSHIKELVKARLTFPEIVHAITIMVYFHSMSSMLHALGIEAASGQLDLSFSPPTELGRTGSESSPRSSELSTGGVAVLLQRMKKLTADETSSSNGSSSSQYGEGGRAHSSAGASGFDSPSSYLDTSAPKFVFDTDDATEDEKHLRFSIYSPNMNFTYKDFYRRGEKHEAPTLKYQHQWEEIGFSLLAQFTSQEFANAIDQKFKTALNMTYNTCGDQSNVNTEPFRRAIWNYTQSLYGIRRDDYNYGLINELLDRPLKMFLKTMSVAPELLLSSDSTTPSIVDDLMTSEQIHIVIIAAEARLQASLVYAMLAVEHYYM